MIFTENNCFYFGGISVDGYRPVPENFLHGENNFFVDGYSAAMKQKVFGFIKDCLKANNIQFTELNDASNCNGIICEKFKIFDKKFCNFSVEKSAVICVENFKNFDCKIIENRIAEILEEQEKNYKRCIRFLSACKVIGDDAARLDNRYINKTKINSFTQKQWEKISQGLKGRIGIETVFSVTCLTPDGWELNMEAFDCYCDKVLTVVDNDGAVAEMIVDRLRGYALGAGYDVVSCQCALGKTEHLIIPELKFGVFTSKYYHRSDFENERKIYAKRFLNPAVEDIKFRREFNAKAYRKMMNEVFTSLEEIEKCNRKIDKTYSEIIDNEKLKKYTEEVLFALT